MAPPDPNAGTGGDPNTIGALPFWKSPQFILIAGTVVSALVAKFPKIGLIFGITDSASAEAFVTSFAGGIAILAPIVAGTLRWRSKVQPLTVTQNQADNHPATAVATQRASTVVVSPAPPKT